MSQTLINSEFFVEGMHCAACELLIETKLGAVKGIIEVDAKLAQSKVYLQSERPFEASELSLLVEENGYHIVPENKTNHSLDLKQLAMGAVIALLVFLLFLLLQKLGIVNLINPDQITYPFVFLIGIVASLSTCMAVVGGLVLSLSGSYALTQNKWPPLLTFHLSRILAFFILGGLIGLIGAAFTLTAVSTFILNLILFAVMLIMGINLLDVFPATRRWQLKLPKKLGKHALKLQQRRGILTAAALGAITFILPCGFTQSMQVYSLTTGSFLSGALTMFVFALGTLPVLGLISIVSVKFSNSLQSGIFFKTAGFLVILFALFNFASALVAIGVLPPFLNV